MSKDNFFNHPELKYSERVILAEDLNLPDPDNDGYNPLSDFTDLNGKFYLPILTPLLDNDITYDKHTTKPNSDTLITSEYVSSNYITLVIPKYILLQFAYETIIPAGTEFILTSIGGQMKIDYYRIIGVYTTTATNTLEESKGGSR